MEEFTELISPWQLKEGEVQEEMPWKISAEDMKSHKEKVGSAFNEYLVISYRLIGNSESVKDNVIYFKIPR